MELRHRAEREGKLSTFLKGELSMSTGLINRLKTQSCLLVNGQPVRTNYPVAPGDEIRVLLLEPETRYPPEEMALSILYEDRDLIALDKPQGMLVHPSRSRNSGTLANGLLYYFRQTGQDCAFHPVSRLDRDTYGVVLLAKNAHVHAKMNELHQLGRIEKTYEALVFGCPASASGMIDAPIERLPLPSLLRRVSPSGKPSRTLFRVMEAESRGARLELRPLTGRTHQLRVHCAYMGFPILGDPQYGTPASMALSAELGLTAQALCAVRLAFPHPRTGENVVISSRLRVPSERLRGKFVSIPPETVP